MKSSDEDVEINLTKARRRNYIGKKEEAIMMSRESFSLRLVKVRLNDGKALYNEIRVNVVPIRPDRHYHRTKGQLASDFSNTHKRSF